VSCVGPLCGPPLRWWVLCGALPSVWVPCLGPLCGSPVWVPRPVALRHVASTRVMSPARSHAPAYKHQPSHEFTGLARCLRAGLTRRIARLVALTPNHRVRSHLRHINQSIKDPHNATHGQGEATSQHHHRGAQPVRHEATQAWGAVSYLRYTFRQNYAPL